MTGRGAGKGDGTHWHTQTRPNGEGVCVFWALPLHIWRPHMHRAVSLARRVGVPVRAFAADAAVVEKFDSLRFSFAVPDRVLVDNKEVGITGRVGGMIVSARPPCMCEGLRRWPRSGERFVVRVCARHDLPACARPRPPRITNLANRT